MWRLRFSKAKKKKEKSCKNPLETAVLLVRNHFLFLSYLKHLRFSSTSRFSPLRKHITSLCEFYFCWNSLLFTSSSSGILKNLWDLFERQLLLSELKRRTRSCSPLIDLSKFFWVIAIKVDEVQFVWILSSKLIIEYLSVIEYKKFRVARPNPRSYLTNPSSHYQNFPSTWWECF